MRLGTMSSSDEVSDVKCVDKIVDRSLFVRLLSENPVVVEKSKTPSAVAAKKTAWDSITKEYFRATGKKTTPKSLAKMLNNMKTKIKIKTDKKATGNQNVILKDWEKDFLNILSQKESPIFQKIPRYTSVGLTTERHLNKNNNIDIVHQVTSQNIATPILNEGDNIVMLYETDETKDLTIPQLQRVVLLQQMELQKIQIEKEKLLLENLKKCCNDNDA